MQEGFKRLVSLDQYCSKYQRASMNLLNLWQIDISVPVPFDMGLHSTDRRDVFAPIDWKPLGVIWKRFQTNAER